MVIINTLSRIFRICIGPRTNLRRAINLKMTNLILQACFATWFSTKPFQISFSTLIPYGVLVCTNTTMIYICNFSSLIRIRGSKPVNVSWTHDLDGLFIQCLMIGTFITFFIKTVRLEISLWTLRDTVHRHENAPKKVKWKVKISSFIRVEIL